MTDEQLREIQKRCDAATPGPWRFWSRDITPLRITDRSGRIDALLDAGEDARGFNREEDAAFVASARQDIPSLLAEIKILKGNLSAMEAHKSCLLQRLRDAEGALEAEARKVERLGQELDVLRAAYANCNARRESA